MDRVCCKPESKILDTGIYMFLLIFFSIMFCLRILITVPSAILMALLFIHPSYVWMCKLDYKAEH